MERPGRLLFLKTKIWIAHFICAVFFFCLFSFDLKKNYSAEDKTHFLIRLDKDINFFRKNNLMDYRHRFFNLFWFFFELTFFLSFLIGISRKPENTKDIKYQKWLHVKHAAEPFKEDFLKKHFTKIRFQIWRFFFLKDVSRWLYWLSHSLLFKKENSKWI